MNLVWFRRDLRIADNTALLTATRHGPTVAVFIISPQQWLEHDDAPIKVKFWLENLRELQTRLAACNIPLLIRYSDHWNNVPDVLLSLCQEHDVTHIHCNDEFGVNEVVRDEQSAACAQQNGIDFTIHSDRCFIPPGIIKNQSGNYFKVFSQFKKHYQDYLFPMANYADGVPEIQNPVSIVSDVIPTSIAGYDLDQVDLSLWPVGEDAAQQYLNDFVDDRMARYDQIRDLPFVDGTSKLSSYLAAGIISVRQCIDAALAVRHDTPQTVGIDTWINELIWRDFYNHILFGYPHVSRHKAFKQHMDQMVWLNEPDMIEAWKHGRTGFPIIDAAMRQLHATGWMHNRLRMIVAMFLTKNLLVDWRIGETWFMQHLIDGDLAANNGGWQWSASTGTDAVPYFRIFNPVTQSERFDPNGDFIRQWIPELQHVSNKEIHDPWKNPLAAAQTGYPQPIVDLKVTRARAIAFFKSYSA